MKKLLPFFCFAFITSNAFTQIKAVTDNGDEVILNIDGTWKYLNDSLQNSGHIDTSKQVFVKPASATFLIKSNKIKCGVYIDPKKWSFEKSEGDKPSEFNFELKGKDAYGLLITEKIEMPFETLKNAALENAKSVAPDIKISKQEYRKVNNNLVLLLQMDGTIQGIKFSYYGYYFSSANGTIQLLTYTSSNLLNEYKKDFEDFLNGCVITE